MINEIVPMLILANFQKKRALKRNSLPKILVLKSNTPTYQNNIVHPQNDKQIVNYYVIILNKHLKKLKLKNKIWITIITNKKTLKNND